MAKKAGRIGEADITCDVLRELASAPHGEMTTTDLISALRVSVKLGAGDQEILDNRNDDRFSQIVRNIKSHKKSPGNIIHDGLVDDVQGGFKITAAGRLHLQNICP